MRTFRVVITGHGPMAVGLLAGAQMIAGPLLDVAVVPLEAGMGTEDFDARLIAAIGPGRALVLCDLRGGTPHNRAQVLTRRSNDSVCLAGVNMAMLLEAVLADGDLNPALVARIAAAGRNGIVKSAVRRPG